MRNKRLFETIVRKTQPQLKNWLKGQLWQAGYKEYYDEDGYLYAEGDIPVMLIAHLDTVHKEPVVSVCWDSNYNVAMSPQGIGGDDRCGIYMILRVIRELKCHVLFCEDEEIGGVGALQFTHSGLNPAVNFLIEFDRKGNNDAVFYDCDNEDFTDLLKQYGFKEEYGSFSDISHIAPHFGVAAVNVSSGYYRQHTTSEYINMREMNTNADRIAKLIRENNGTFYEYVESPHTWKNWRNYSGYTYGYGGKDYGTFGTDYSYLSAQQDDDDRQYDTADLMGLETADSDLLISSDGEQYEILKDEAFCYALDQYGNLYVNDYANVWSYYDTPFLIEKISDKDEEVVFDQSKAIADCTVDYNPGKWEVVNTASTKEDKPWSETGEEVVV